MEHILLLHHSAAGKPAAPEAINMRVKSITVKGLFGVFDHEIPLQSAERVTIIHGPNGFGKTMMLKMIAALVEGETYIFEHTPFTEFCLTFEDGTARIIRRRVAEKSESGKREVELEFSTRDSSGNTENDGRRQVFCVNGLVIVKPSSLVN